MPGWQLYVDSHDQIVGLCVDDKNPTIRGGTVILREPYIDRARALLTKHFGAKVSAEITQGLCNFLPDRVPYGLLRWEQYPTMVRAPDGEPNFPGPTPSGTTCCWEWTPN